MILAIACGLAFATLSAAEVALAPIWQFLHRVDYTALDRMVAAAVDGEAGSNLVVSLVLDPPAWYAQHNAGDRVVLDGEPVARMSYASRVTLKDTRIVLDKVLQHLKHGPFNDRIAGYVLVGGEDGCFGQRCGRDGCGDRSRVMRFSERTPARCAADFIVACAKTAKDVTERMKTVGIRTAASSSDFLQPDAETLRESVDLDGPWTASAERQSFVPPSDAKFISPAEKRAGHSVAAFYRQFRLEKPVRKATLSATALGTFVLSLNGRRIGDGDFLKPGYTESGKCRHVFAYDVTEALAEGGGEGCSILATVAPTWWCDQILQAEKPTPWQLGKEVAFWCELKFEYADGTTGTLNTDTDWLAAYSAATQTAGLYEGEVYDERESVNDLSPAKVNAEFRGELRPATAKVVLREDLTLVPKDIYVTCGAEGATDDAYGRAKIVRRYREGDRIALNPGEMLVLDFGQNCAAVPMFQFDGRPGTTIEIRHAEMLNESNGEKGRGNDGPAGTPYLASLRSAYAGIRYTMAGGGDTYRPSFTFFGYRYLGVTTTAPVTFQRIRSVPVSSITKEMERGAITTGDARVNRLIENIRWGLMSNYVSIPTDCPQRDERLGWTADTQVFMNSAAYLADTCEFLRKYLADLRDGQYDDGLYTCFVPNVRHVFPHWASCGWTDAGVLIPYRLWKWYGRTEILDECWDSMERYMGFLERNEKPYRINHADWLAYEHKDTRPGADNRAQDPVYKEVMNAYFRLWMVRLMRDMARATGRLGRAAHYARQDYFLKMAFDLDYLAPDGTIKDYWKGQCSDLYMLKLGLCGNAAAVEATKKDLIDNIRAHGNRLQTGFLGTAILMPTLTFEANAPDVAYDLLFQDQDPSWLYEVDQGATTVWERWNSYTKEKGFGPTSMNSFNHYAYGCVLEWLFSAAAGIRPDPNQGGWKHFILQPFADRRLGHLEASYDSPVGRITSAWKYDADGKLHWSFSIPEGATATVIAPGGTTREYAGGAYEL